MKCTVGHFPWNLHSDVDAPNAELTPLDLINLLVIKKDLQSYKEAKKSNAAELKELNVIKNIIQSWI